MHFLNVISSRRAVKAGIIGADYSCEQFRFSERFSLRVFA